MTKENKEYLADLKLVEENDDSSNLDWRHAINARGFISTDSYADQPYIIKTDDGAWLCTVTTNASKEGDAGQKVISMRSSDMGKTWSEPVSLEEDDGRENSYSVLLKVPSGRIYSFYNHNTDNIRRVKADNPPYEDGYCYRVDSIGYYVFKYSDDFGKSWSKKRYPIPVREFEIDRKNADKGKLRYFWNVGKPFVIDGDAFVSLHKVGSFGRGFFTSSEGVLLKSSNILYENDPEKITWETLPEGDIGLRTPKGGGPISEEQSYSLLSDGSIYVVYRSIDGHPVFSYSRDQGKTWDQPQYKRYADGRLIKHPRAACFAWACNNGKYLYWYHNHGGKNYDDRNPVWVLAGQEVDGKNGKEIAWSQPEILLYEDDTYVRMSYPDLIEDQGKLFISETNKTQGRIHQIKQEFLDKLWSQFTINKVEDKGLLLELIDKKNALSSPISMPELPIFNKQDYTTPDLRKIDYRSGFTIEFLLKVSKDYEDTILMDNRLESNQGLYVDLKSNGQIGIHLNDGRTQNTWYCEPNLLKTDSLNHVAIVVDGGPKIISFIINGAFSDGNDFMQFGWGRFSSDLRYVKGKKELTIINSEKAALLGLRIYNRALMTSEVIGNYRSST